MRTVRGLRGILGPQFVLCLALVGAAPAQEPIAIIVHPGTPVTTISRDDIRRLYLGMSTTLPNRVPVILLETITVRDRFYSVALGMNRDRFIRHWIGLVFAGEASSPPKALADDEVLRVVATRPGAIAFISARSVDASVKILAVEGRYPGDAGYRLR